MANILVLVPMKHDLDPILRLRAHTLMAALEAKEREIGEHQIEVKARTCHETGDGRPYSAHAEARNAMLPRYLRKHHTHVLWIDADVVDYPADLATRLHARDSEGIIAPVPLIEGSDRFYDVYGFVNSRGQRMARPYPPYMDMSSMLSVGTCYLAPASIYHAGARYATTEGHTEHYSVCRHAVRVSVTSEIIIRHANLPAWGLEWNTL